MGVDAQMFVRTMEPVDDGQLKTWNWEIVEAFGRESFMLYGEGQRALGIIDEYYQDTEDSPLRPHDGETFIDVSLGGRYYGVGYERGNLPEQLAIAAWLEHRVPGATVWYGGDSSGIEAEPWDKAMRDHIWRYFCKMGHRPYLDDPRDGAPPLPEWKTGLMGDVKVHAPRCPSCEEPCRQYGYGSSWSFYCPGCGFDVPTKDEGKTYKKAKSIMGDFR